MNEKVGIVIVNWNTGKLLADCLRSIQRLPEAGRICAVAVIDNSSKDGSVSQARSVSGPVKIVFKELAENAGFARANNIGIEMINKENSECHIMLLNPDTEVTSGSVEALAKEVEENDRVGIAGPKLINGDGTLQPSVRRFPSLISIVFTWFKLHKLFPKAQVWREYLYEDFDYEKSQDVDQVMGAAFMIKADMLKKIGKLDEGFWIWFEEVDYCKRAVDFGYKVRYSSVGRIIHYGGVSFGQVAGLKKAWPWIRSSLRYAGKHLGLVAWVMLLMLVPSAMVMAVAIGILPIKAKSKNINAKQQLKI